MNIFKLLLVKSLKKKRRKMIHLVLLMHSTGLDAKSEPCILDAEGC